MHTSASQETDCAVCHMVAPAGRFRSRQTMPNIRARRKRRRVRCRFSSSSQPARASCSHCTSVALSGARSSSPEASSSASQWGKRARVSNANVETVTTRASASRRASGRSCHGPEGSALPVIEARLSACAKASTRRCRASAAGPDSASGSVVVEKRACGVCISTSAPNARRSDTTQCWSVITGLSLLAFHCLSGPWERVSPATSPSLTGPR